jgi:hypothetical protein
MASSKATPRHSRRIPVNLVMGHIGAAQGSSRRATLEEQPKADEHEEPERDRESEDLRSKKVVAHLSVVPLSSPA